MSKELIVFILLIQAKIQQSGRLFGYIWFTIQAIHKIRLSMKFIKIPVFLLSISMVWARPWQKLLNNEPISIKVTSLESMELENHIKVYYKQNTLLPKINFQLIINGGEAEETAADAGINALWGKSVVYSGSKKYPREQLSQILEMRGSEFDFDSSLERSMFSIDSLSEYFQSDLDIALDVLKNPAFMDKDVSLLKSQTLQSLKKRTENPAGMAYLAAQMIQWKDNIRGLISTEKSVKKITPEALKSWHEKMMAPDRFSILITGDIEIAEMKKILDEGFGRFNKPEVSYNASSLKVDESMIKSGNEKIYHQAKEIPQTTILFRAPGIRHADKDYYALKLYDYLLGGNSFNSYLTQVIRVKNGWSYSVYSSYTAGEYEGSLSIFAQTQNKNVIPLITEVKNILDKPEVFVTGEKLESAKKSLRNGFVFLAETPEKLARLQLSLKWDNLPEDYLNTFLGEIDKVDVKDLIRVAKKYYSPGKFFINVVGPENIFKPVEANPEFSGRISVFQIPE